MDKLYPKITFTYLYCSIYISYAYQIGVSCKIECFQDICQHDQSKRASFTANLNISKVIYPAQAFCRGYKFLN